MQHVARLIGGPATTTNHARGTSVSAYKNTAKAGTTSAKLTRKCSTGSRWPCLQLWLYGSSGRGHGATDAALAELARQADRDHYRHDSR